MDLTMLRQACRRGRMAAAMTDATTGESDDTSELRNLLKTEDRRRKDLPDNSQWMTDITYGLLLHHLNAQNHVRYDDARGGVRPVRLGSLLLTQDAIPLTKLSYREREFSINSQHEGNSRILFRAADGSTHSGIITEMWCKAIHPSTEIRTFVRVAVHRPLLAEDATKDPFQHFPGFKRRMFYAVRSEHDNLIIEKDDIIYHATHDFFPPGEFGIEQATIAIYYGLIQGRTIFN